MNENLEAQLDRPHSRAELLGLRPIKVTRNTALFFGDSVSRRLAHIESGCSWMHNISIRLAGVGQITVVAALCGKALDAEEEPIFERRSVPGGGLLRFLQAAANCSNDEHVDSLIFEAFELASRLSRENGRKGSPLRMQRLKRFIEQECHRTVTLERMARVAGLSTFACLRQFREATGTTPHAYLVQCRIRTARGLLCADAGSVAAVARAAGFSDQAHFARIFKRSTGMTPMEYRRAALRDLW